MDSLAKKHCSSFSVCLFLLALRVRYMKGKNPGVIKYIASDNRGS